MRDWDKVQTGQQATCSVCSDTIMMRDGFSRENNNDKIPEYARTTEGYDAKRSESGWAVKHEYLYRGWEHVNDNSRLCAREGGRPVRPKEFCGSENQSSYRTCGKKVPLENIHAEVYCCGVHAKKEFERLKAQEARDAAQRKREEQEAEDAWELSVQRQAWERLAMTPLAEALKVGEALAGTGRYSRWSDKFRMHDCDFNPLQLLELLEDHYQLKERADANTSEG